VMVSKAAAAANAATYSIIISIAAFAPGPTGPA
jgi:hypothetical protein